MDDFRVVMASLPPKVKALSIEKDGYYTIVLNKNLSREQQFVSCLHEINHIEHRDFEKFDTDLIEFYAHA